MTERQKGAKAFGKGLMPAEIEKKDLDHSRTPCSINETSVDLLDLEIRRWIKVIKPSRASLTYERYE